MPDGQDYISKTYRALKDNITGFDKTETQFRQLISSDTNYRNKVYTALKDNIDGFTRTPEEFNGLIVLKQPKISKLSASASATGVPVEAPVIQAPDGNPETQQKIFEVTQYLQNKTPKQVQDNLIPPKQLKISADIIASKEKEAELQNITEQIREDKKILSGKTVTGEYLQAKYGLDWQKKATKQEMLDYGQGLKEYYDKQKEKGVEFFEPKKVNKGEEAMQQAADELYKTPLGKLFYNVIQPVGKAGGSALSGTVSTATRYGGMVLGLDEITEGIADWVNENINPENRWAGTMAGSKPTKLHGNLFNDGKVNASKILPSTIEALTTMAWLTGGGSGSGQLMGRSFLLTEQEYRNEGKRYGLSGDALDRFALTSSVLTSALEMISPNRLITGSEKKAFAKVYSKAITDGFTSKVATKMALKEFKQGILKENLQEISQMIGDKAVRYITDKTSETPVFNDDLSFNGIKDELAETVLLTSLSTGFLQSPNTIRNSNPTNLEKSTWYNVAENPDQFKEFINKQIVDGVLTQEQAANANTFFNKYQTAVNQAKDFELSPDQQKEVAWQIFKGNDIEEIVNKFQSNPVLKQTISPIVKKEQEEITTNIKRIGMGVPDIGTEVTGQELGKIIGNIGDKGGSAEDLQTTVEDNTYRVDEINLKDLYNQNQSFREYVDNFQPSAEEPEGLLVPAIIDLENNIVDGRKRLAQQYKDGKTTAQVFKQLKTEEHEQATTGGGSTEDARIEARQPTEGERTGARREGEATQADDRYRSFSSKENEIANEIRGAIREGKFKGIPSEIADQTPDTELVNFIYDQATQTMPDPETGEPTTARPLLDETFGADLVDRVIALKEQISEQPVSEQPVSEPPKGIAVIRPEENIPPTIIPLKTGEGVSEVAPVEEVQQPVTEEGFKKEPGKKSLLGRAFEGESSDSMKEKIAYYGLNYETQTHEEARETAQQIIKELGLDKAVDAVVKGIVKDAEAAMIWAEAIDYIGEQIANETDPNKIAELEKAEASLLNQFDIQARGAGRFISSLNNIYNNSNFSYKLSERISRYKNLNNGEIPAEIEEKYRELDKKYQELLKQIAEMDKRSKEQHEQQAMDNIKEETARATKREPKKTSTDKAKKIAEIIRKGKIQKPGIFMSSSPVSAIWDTALEITAKAVEAGGRLSDAIIAGVEYIKQTEWYKNLNKDQQKEAVNSFSSGVNSEVNKEIKKPFINEDGKIIIPPSVIREYVEGGIDNINDLTEAIKQDLIEEYPDVTNRQVRDAITEYGKTINPSQDEVSQQISKMKNIGRIISALEDIAIKKRPLKSGLQRRKYDTQERALQKQLREALKELPADTGVRDKQLKTTLEAIKTRLRNSIEDIEREIATGEKRAANKGDVVYDEEAKALREERDRLREIRDEIFGDEVTEEQRISRALNVTERSIEKLEQKIKDNDLSYSQKQTLDSPELKAARGRLKKLRDTIGEMREQAGVAEAARLETAKKRVEKRIAELRQRLNNKDFSKKQKRVLEADAELIKLNAEKLAVQEEYSKEEYKAELKNRNAAQKLKDAATEVWGLTRVFMATGELSFIGIQGGLFSLTHPKIAIRAFGKMLSHMASERRFNEWERIVKSQPYYPALKASKLALSEYDSKLTAREEIGVSGWANHIWDYALYPVKFVSNSGYEFLKTINPLKAIERAGVAYMNHIRLQRFLTGMEKLQLEGKTFTTNPDDYKRMADVINTLSGRASLGKLEPNAQTLALLFFSPRNWASMIKQFPPIFFTRQMYKWRGSDGNISVAQKMAVSDYMKFVTITGGMLLAMAAYYKHDDDDETEVVFDPTSSDFLKIKNKNTRVDVFGGRTQMVVYTLRNIFDEKTTLSGKTTRLGSGFFTPTKRDLLIDMVSNKLAPTAGVISKYLDTKLVKNKDGSYTRVNKYTGEKYSISGEVSESTQPIFWGTVREIHKDQPKEVAYFLDVLAAIGVNIATYQPKPKKTNREKLNEKINKQKERSEK